ncbi:hypothetical protein RRG08_052740 [Elysia crispata]|uniref:VWFC domain-containing protein n=1 Tax=Elysia crispata TaxID=231223 RepID=A0AAE1EAF0_9GAST|nr:hypothetical protein RRG08_052740 [Elysia crispata]
MLRFVCKLWLIILWSVVYILPHTVPSPYFTLMSTALKGRGNHQQDLPGCYLGGQHYKFGARWSPVMEPTGTMVCLKCECLQVEKKGIIHTKGETICRNIKHRCPDVTCSNPKTLPGRCCKICGPEDDIEADLTFRQERRPVYPLEHLSSDDSQIFTGTSVYTAILMEAPPRFSRPLWSEDRMNIRQVAVLRLTFTPESSELDFAVRFAFGPDQLIHLQLVDMSGEVHLQKSFMLGSSSWDNKICGTLSHVPSVYKSYLDNGQLMARIITSTNHDDFIVGKINPDSESQEELFSGVLHPAVPNGSGGNVRVSYTPRTRTAILKVTIRKGQYDAATSVYRLAVMHKAERIFLSPELVLSKFDQLEGIWTMRSKRYRRLLSRGKLRIFLLRGGPKPEVLLEGALLLRLFCDVFQAISTEPDSIKKFQPGTSLVTSALLTLGDKGWLRFRVRIKDATPRRATRIFLEGSRPKHARHQIWKRPSVSTSSFSDDGNTGNEYIRGRYTKLDMSTLYRLIHNRMYVTVAFNESVKVKTALVSLKGRPPRSDTKAIWLTLAPALSSQNNGDRIAAQLQLSMSDCSLRIVGLLASSVGQRTEANVKLSIAKGLREELSSKDEWHAEMKKRLKQLRGYRKLEGKFSRLPDNSLLALDRGYAYLQVTLGNPETDQAVIQTQKVQARVSNKCWRGRGVLNREQSTVTATQLKDEESLEEQKDPTATQDGFDDDGQLVTCTFEGQVYQEGSAWLPDVDAKCTTCSCVKSKVMCQRMICPDLSCADPVTVDGECCPSCSIAEGSVEKCQLGQDPRTYRLHSTWHPYLPLEGFSRCAICTCLPGGRSVCSKAACPALSCERLMWVKSDTDPCCYICAREQRTQSSTQPLQQDVNMQGACFDRGQLRKNGESWHPTIQTFGFMKCVICHCRDGSFICELLKCPKLMCARRKKKPNVCCEVCEDASFNSLGESIKLAVKKPPKFVVHKRKEMNKTKKKRKDCKINGRVYVHGEKWRPRTVGLHDNCAVCRCKNGNAKCRMRCPRTCKADKKSHRCCKHCKEKATGDDADTFKAGASMSKTSVETKVFEFEERMDLIQFLQ